MNLTQSPPYPRAEIAHNALKSGSMGIISSIRQNFSGGGLKTKDTRTVKEILINSNPFILFFIWLESDNKQ